MTTEWNQKKTIEIFYVIDWACECAHISQMTMEKTRKNGRNDEKNGRNDEKNARNELIKF